MTATPHRGNDVLSTPFCKGYISFHFISFQEGTDEAHVEDYLFSEEPMWVTYTDFLDPKYNLLDLLTPTTTQNRLSYLVELVILQTSKQISNEALKLRQKARRPLELRICQLTSVQLVDI